MICQWCEEPIEGPAHSKDGWEGMHQECAYRAACGSLAHIAHRCSCYVPDSQEGDPEGLTKREAAMEAWPFGILLHTVMNARSAN